MLVQRPNHNEQSNLNCTHHTSSGMKDRHVLQDGSTIVGDDDFTVAGLNL